MTRTRALWPHRVEQDDRRHVIRGLARWLCEFGFPPTDVEMALYMKADIGALRFHLRTLKAAGLVRRGANNQSAGRKGSRWLLTASGWASLGYEPVEPWMKPPSKAVVARAVNAAATRVVRLLEKERSND